jgi:hypothetical protein
MAAARFVSSKISGAGVPARTIILGSLGAAGRCGSRTARKQQGSQQDQDELEAVQSQEGLWFSYKRKGGE